MKRFRANDNVISIISPTCKTHAFLSVCRDVHSNELTEYAISLTALYYLENHIIYLKDL